MKEEQEYLQDWKIEKIIQASGEYYINHRVEVQQLLLQHQREANIVMYSFVDCPWCIAAKSLLLEQQPYTSIITETMPSSLSSQAKSGSGSTI